MRKIPVRAALLGTLVALLMLPLAHAQLPRSAERWPGAEAAPGATPQFELPSLTDDERKDTLSSAVRVQVSRIRLTGNTVFPPADLAAITAPYENRVITSEELQALRLALTRYYVDRGYINSGAVIPDQAVVDGVVEIQLIEGHLSDVVVAEGGRLRPDYIARRLWPGSAPLDVNVLQERLQILLLDPLVEGVNGELVPCDQLGEAVLEARVREASLLRLTLGTDNRISPALGEIRGVVSGELRNPFGLADVLFAEAAFAEGSDSFAVDYAVPLNRYDTRLGLSFNYNDAEVVEAPFADINIASRSRAFGVGLTHPIIRTPNTQLTLGWKFERREATTFALNRRFSFANELDEGRSSVSVFRFSQDWLNRTSGQVFAARSTLSFGIDAFGATGEGDPDGEFVSWLGQFQWARRFGERGYQLLFRANAQLSSDALLPLERFGVGGLDSVRGYRYNRLVRDEGFSTSLEARFPVQRDVTGRNALQLVTFIDAGGARNNRGETPKPDFLWSLGAGLRFDPTPNIRAELYWAQALESVGEPDDSIQDSGLHFRLRAGLDLF